MSTKISSNDKFVETVNQNFFIRTTITTVAKLALAQLIFSGVAAISYIIFVAIAAASGSMAAVILFVIVLIVAAIFFLYYFVHSVNNLLTLHKKVTKVERSIIKSMK